MNFGNTIGKYTLHYFGKRYNASLPIATIYLYTGSNQYLGTVSFFRDGQKIPNNSSKETTNPKRAYLKMHERQLDTVVDMLRNEKPCKMYYSNPKAAELYTGKEPVGEEETQT